MMPIRIYLSFLVGTEWTHSVYRDISTLRDEWSQLIDSATLSVIHVGYERPEYVTDSLLKISNDITRPMFLTESAKWSLPPAYNLCSSNIMSSCSFPNRNDSCPIYLSTKGWGYEIEESHAVLKNNAEVKNLSFTLDQNCPSDWLESFYVKHPNISDILKNNGIFTEDTYINFRASLPTKARNICDSYRRDYYFSSKVKNPYDILSMSPLWLLDMPVQSIQPTVRLQNVFNSNKINIVRDLLNFTADDLLKMQNFGRKSLPRIQPSSATL